MPIYEYECLKCGKIHEVTQKISDDPLKKCPTPKCGGKVNKLISRTSFALKGSGWYTSDYKRSGSEKKTVQPKAETSKPAASSKPEGKSS
jgi:putative FmdB family regulatory protein